MTIAYDAPPAAEVQYLPTDRGSGRIAQAPEGQCGGVDEDSRDCSREGRQNGPAGGWTEFRSYDAQYQLDREVGYVSGLAVAAGPGEVWRAKALAKGAMPEGARLLGWWPTTLNQSVLAGLV